MSIEVQPPSPSQGSSSLQSPSSRVRGHREKHSPPAALDTQSFRRKHRRSSSWSGFVSLILPSQRSERAQTLRNEYRDDGSQAATDLVFGMVGFPGSNHSPGVGRSKHIMTQNTECGRNPTDAEKNHTRSGPPDRHGSLGPHLNELTRRDIHTTQLNKTERAQEKKASSLGRFFSSRRHGKKGEGKHLRHYAISPRQQQAVFDLPMLSSRRENFDYEESQKTKTQQIFQDKKDRREQRKSLRESGDFLGVQGANPRTGYWDISTATSSSDPSQQSEETKRKIEQQAKEVAEQKRKYEEAQARHESELVRIRTLRDKDKKDRAEQKAWESKIKQRRHGKWKLSENGWSSVAEPDLSPIVQSLAGSPTRETIPSDCLFPMPSANEPNPYIDSTSIEQQDYFKHRKSPSPQTHHHCDRTLESAAGVLSKRTIPRKPVGSPPRTRSCSTETILRRDNFIESMQNQTSTFQHYIPLSAFKNESFGQKILHTGNNQPKETNNSPRIVSPTPESSSFLDKMFFLTKPGGTDTKEAIAISSPLVSMSQAQTHPPLSQNFWESISEPRIMSLNEFPPVWLKDPTTARIPSSFQVLKGSPPLWAPPTIPKTRPDTSIASTTTPTITTTGCPPLHLSAQFDGVGHTTGMTNLFFQGRSGRIPLRVNSHQKSKQNSRQSNKLQARQAGTATLSEHQLVQTKQRTLRLCQMVTPGGEMITRKNTPTCISMSLPTPEKQKITSQNTALVAFQNSRYLEAMRRTGVRVGDVLITPKGTKQCPKKPNGKDGKAGALPREHGDKGGPSTEIHEDSLVVWHASPDTKYGKAGDRNARRNQGPPPARGQTAPPQAKTEKAANGMNKNEEGKDIGVVLKAGRSSSKQSPKPGQVSFAELLVDITSSMVQTAWEFVEPVFNAESNVRMRWEQRQITWQDVGLFTAAAVFAAGMVLMIAALARFVGMGLQVARSFLALFRLFIGL